MDPFVVPSYIPISADPPEGSMISDNFKPSLSVDISSTYSMQFDPTSPPLLSAATFDMLYTSAPDPQYNGFVSEEQYPGHTVALMSCIQQMYSGMRMKIRAPELFNPLYKTELCRSFEETGQCRYVDKCQFAHGLHELRMLPRHPKYKTEICKTFHTIGTCPYGTRCRFIHKLLGEEGEGTENGHMVENEENQLISLLLESQEYDHLEKVGCEELQLLEKSYELLDPQTVEAPTLTSSSDSNDPYDKVANIASTMTNPKVTFSMLASKKQNLQSPKGRRRALSTPNVSIPTVKSTHRSLMDASVPSIKHVNMECNSWSKSTQFHNRRLPVFQHLEES
jgi:hypothetical protein